MFLRNQVLREAATNTNTGPGTGAPPQAAWYGDDAHKAFVEAKGFKSAADVITSYQNLEKLPALANAGRTVVLPKDANDVDGIKAYRAKIGVPEKADGYKTPDALKDDPLWGPARDAALKHGIPAGAFDAFMADVLGAATALNEKTAGETKAAGERAVAELKAKHGDKFDARMEMGKRLAAGLWPDLQGDALTAKLSALEGAMGTRDFLELMSTLGEKLGESRPAGDGAGGGSGGGGGLTQAQAQQQLQQLNADKIAGKVDQKTFDERVAQLGPIAFPG